jgi:DNA-binding transcriptional LysR family regulator
MELRQLRHFLEVADNASFCQAANKLHITQPALSKSIRNLELSLDVMLLERHPGGVQLTEYGRVLHNYATMVTTELERAREEIDEMRGRGRGLIRVGAGVSLMKYLLPHTVRSFLEEEPKHHVQVRQGLRERLFPMLRRGELDLVVGTINPSLEPEDLRQEVLCGDKLAVVCSDGHKLAGQRDITIADLKDYKWVMPDTSSEPESDRLARLFRRAGFEPPQTVVRTGSSIFMATLLRDSDYLSYVPSALLKMDPEYAHLRALDTEPIWEDIYLGVSWRRKGVMLPGVRRFITTLKRTAGHLENIQQAENPLVEA